MTQILPETPREMLDLRTVELLFSRAFHDLIGPISAVNNGVEMAQETGGGANSDAFRLIDDSAREARNRLSYYRLALGAAGRDPNLTSRQIREDTAKFFSRGKVAVTLPEDLIPEDAPHSPGMMKAIINTLLLAQESLTRGGEIVVTLEGRSIVITARGKTAVLRESYLQALSQTLDLSQLDARTVHAWVMAIVLKDEGIQLDITSPSDGEIVFTLIPPPKSAVVEEAPTESEGTA